MYRFKFLISYKNTSLSISYAAMAHLTISVYRNTRDTYNSTIMTIIIFTLPYIFLLIFISENKLPTSQICSIIKIDQVNLAR